MAPLRAVLPILGVAAVGAAGALALSGSGASRATCPPHPVSQSSSAPVFRSSFEGGDFGEWGGYNRSHQPDEYPAGAAVIDPRGDGVPRREGCRVARFRVTLSDARVHRTHAKLLKAWKVGSGKFGTKPPRDVSGTYRAWYYLPPGYRVRGGGWVNIFQWKESYFQVEGGSRVWYSDPTWWITVERGRSGGVQAVLNNWGGDITAVRPFPRGRWVELRAVLRQGRSIEFFLDGRRFATARQSQYPVSPRYGSRSLGWTFGVGNYSGRDHADARDAVTGPLYVDAIRVHTLR